MESAALVPLMALRGTAAGYTGTWWSMRVGRIAAIATIVVHGVVVALALSNSRVRAEPELANDLAFVVTGRVIDRHAGMPEEQRRRVTLAAVAGGHVVSGCGHRPRLLP